MKKYLIFAILLCTAVGSAQERSGAGLTWLRRATLVTGCAAGMAFDTWAMKQAAADGVRLTGLYGDSQGRPRYGLMIGLNGAACAVSAFFEERHKHWSTGSQWVWIAENSASTGISIWTGIHLLHLGDQAKALRVQPGTLANMH